MPTDDGIIKRHNFRATIGTQNELLAEIRQSLAEARSDTAKQIFKEFDEYRVQQQYCIVHIDIGIDDYNSLKKKFKVD